MNRDTYAAIAAGGAATREDDLSETQQRQLIRHGRVHFFGLTAILLVAISAAAAEDQVKFSPAQAGHGQTLFRERCAACHGDQLEGGDHAPSLKDGNFWAHWNGQTARSLYRKITGTMVDAPGSLDGQNGIDLVAYVLGVNGVPAGGNTIDRVDALDGIRLERPK